MDNYVLAQSWARANVQDRLWYCMTDADKTALAQNENIAFGDKVYIIPQSKFLLWEMMEYGMRCEVIVDEFRCRNSCTRKIVYR